jgi:hypothetical protein
VRAEWPVLSILRPNDVASFERLIAEIDAGPDDSEPSLTLPFEQVATYVEAVRTFVRTRLHLTLHGQPVLWATEFVHNDVTRKGAFRGLASQADSSGTDFIHLILHPSGVNLELYEDGQPVSLDTGSTRAEFSVTRGKLGPGLSADDWERLENEAHQILSDGIATLRERYQQKSQKLNPTKLVDEQATVQQLFRNLFPPYGRPFPKGTPALQQRLRRLTTEIGIDIP